MEHRVLWNTECCGRSRTPAGSGQQSVSTDGGRRLAAGWHPLACGWRLLAGCSPSVAGGAVALMEEMVQHLLTRTVVSWNTVISTCEKGVQWDGDLGLLQEMVQHMRAPNVESWKVAKSACEKVLLATVQTLVHTRRDSSGRESLDWAKRFHSCWQRMW